MALVKRHARDDEAEIQLTSVVKNPIYSGDDDDDLDPQPMGFGNPSYGTIMRAETGRGELLNDGRSIWACWRG